MRRLPVVAVAASCITGQATAQSPREHRVADRPSSTVPAIDTLWSVGLDEAAGSDSLFGVMAWTIAAPRWRRVIVAEPNAGELRLFDQRDGRFLKRLGRRGGGPGELRFADRIAVSDDGHLLAYDRGRGVVVEFDSAGAHVQDTRLDLPVSPETFLASTEFLIFSGIIRQPPFTARAVHVYDRSSGRHLRSFGNLPAAPSEVVSQTIGAGVLAWARDGNIWLAQRAPYLISKYTSDGVLLVRLERENDFLPDAGTAYRIEFQGRRMRIESQPHAVSVALLETGEGKLLHQVWLSGRQHVLDIFDADFRLVASYVGDMPVLAGWSGEDVYAVNGKGLEDQYWIGIARLRLP